MPSICRAVEAETLVVLLVPAFATVAAQVELLVAEAAALAPDQRPTRQLAIFL